jgi:hypothetical protein
MGRVTTKPIKSAKQRRENMVTKEQLKIELDGLEDTQALNQVYQLIQQLKLSFTTQQTKKSTQQEQAMNDFFGMHKDLSVDSVEKELRDIRQGRRGLLNDI